MITPKCKHTGTYMLYSGFSRSVNDVLMLPDASLIVKGVGADEEQILDSNKRLLQSPHIIVIGHSELNASILVLLAIGII